MRQALALCTRPEHSIAKRALLLDRALASLRVYDFEGALNTATEVYELALAAECRTYEGRAMIVQGVAARRLGDLDRVDAALSMLCCGLYTALSMLHCPCCVLDATL